MNILAELRRRFHAALEPLTDDPAPYAEMVRVAQNPQFGDYQANCAMPLKGVLGKNPREIAADIVAKLDVADLCEEPEIAGPGFINLRLKDEWLAAEVNRIARDERLGVPQVTERKKIVIDYSAPNVAKPMHVGHLRSTVIGAALYNILGFLGHEVVSDNHIGDWGTQFGMILYGYKNFLDPAAYQSDPVAELARLYRLVNTLCDYQETKLALPKLEQEHAGKIAALEQAEAEIDPKDKKAKKELGRLRKDIEGLSEELKKSREKIEAVETSPKLNELATAHPDIVRLTREETAKLHAGDAENRRLWDEFLPACLRALEAVYRRMGVEFDLTLGESYYDPMLPQVVADLEAKGLATESQGATCVFLEGHPAPFIVRKADRAYTYATTDLATIRYRAEELKADVMLYVVDARQSDHFKALFECARRWGYDKDFRHLSFGTVLGQDKRPYKTRAGNTVGLESLLDESIIEARKVVDENSPGLDKATRAQVAEKVGIGGIKYADLRHNRESDYVFDWDKMLARYGDTATYCMYAYARVNGIFIKGNEDRDAIRKSEDIKFRITDPAERALALSLARFAEAVEDAAADHRPNLLTAYLFETANRFSAFFENCPVLKSEGDVRASRLLLCDLTGRVIQRGLALLGIETSERM